MAKLKIQKTYTGAPGFQAGATINVDKFVSPITITSNNIGGTGGNEDQTVATIRISYLRDTAGAVDTGYILAQKGSNKFQVNNTSEANSSIVTLVNRLSTELTAANTATIQANTMIITGANLANIGTGGGGYTNNRAFAYVTYATANVAGNSTPGIGHQLQSASSGWLTGNVTVVAINSATNVTVSCATQTVTGNTTGRMSVTDTFNVYRISNKYVWEWDNSKWRYWLSDPYSSGATPLSSQPEWQSVILVRVDNA
jgi:hypothetical protein